MVSGVAQLLPQGGRDHSYDLFVGSDGVSEAKQDQNFVFQPFFQVPRQKPTEPLTVPIGMKTPTTTLMRMGVLMPITSLMVIGLTSQLISKIHVKESKARALTPLLMLMIPRPGSAEFFGDK